MIGNDSPPSRRRYVVACAAAGAGALPGCADLGGRQADRNDAEDDPDGEEAVVPDVPRVEDPPDGVYVPTHREGMIHLPDVEAGAYVLTPMLTYPHRFWLVSGDDVQAVEPDGERGVHLMATVRDRETGAVVPVDVSAAMRTRSDDEVVDERVPWPMISQTMGFHFGDNVPLPGDGTYEVEVRLDPVATRTTGDFEGRFEETSTATFEFVYDEAFREAVVDGIEYVDEEHWGRRGALEPVGAHGENQGDEREGGGDGANDDGDGTTDGTSAGTGGTDRDEDHDGNSDGGDHRMPFPSLPVADEYPGRSLGEPESGDARFVVRHLEETRFTDGDRGYLLVSPRTPYNRVPLPDVALSVRGDVEADLTQTLDGAVGLHYGAPVELSTGDTFELVVDGPPQVSRHAGYETAFLAMPPMSVEVPE